MSRGRACRGHHGTNSACRVNTHYPRITLTQEICITCIMTTVNFPLVVLGTVVTGCANSLFSKYQDNQCVRNCDGPVADQHFFEQPALQTLQMFVGELAVYIVYKYMYSSKRPQPQVGVPAEELSLSESLKLAIPSICDLCATTMLNVGLLCPPVSGYQMIRGSLVLFVGLLLVVFLGRKITRIEWTSLFLVTLGIALVGLSGSNNADGADSGNINKPPSLVAVGISLIVVAELCQAVQFVVEEHILGAKDIVPLKLVYLEGFYGCTILLFVLIVLNFVVGALQNPKDFTESPFNIRESFSQMFGNGIVLFSSIMIMVSIAAFNYFGITLTHILSATARSTIDACRTLLVWILALFFGWESFHWLQMFGFVLLVLGTLAFNGVIHPETWLWVPQWFKKNSHHVPIEEPLLA